MSSVRRAVRAPGQVVRPKLDDAIYAFEFKTARPMLAASGPFSEQYARTREVILARL
jgi:hypothetical protein